MDQDPRNNARAAREGFARGLALLQDPNLPPDMMSAAEPIARAMGALLQVERSDGRASSIRPHAEGALAAAREALGKLQAMSNGNAVAENALAAIAGSLGLVHGLSKAQSIAPAPAAAAPPPVAAPPVVPHYAPPPLAAPQYVAPPVAAPQYTPPAATHQHAPPAAPPQYAPPPVAAPQYAAPAAPQATVAQPPAYAAPPEQATAAAAAAANAAGSIRMGESIAPPQGAIEAELGAHSASNFYKTLSGNDIVDHGGIFVATYAVPRMAAQLPLRIHLPGGYHFDCQGLVKWTREQRDNPDAPPGFGAQMFGITAEQRQLIMRYVRNREPLFYDDL